MFDSKVSSPSVGNFLKSSFFSKPSKASKKKVVKKVAKRAASKPNLDASQFDVKFQVKHSRNSHDWTLQREDGRLVFVSNGGVLNRVAILVELLRDRGQANTVEMLKHLQSIHSGYTQRDLKQPLQILVENKKVCVKVRHGIRTFRLSSEGKKLF